LERKYIEKGRFFKLNLLRGRPRLSVGATEEAPEFFDVSTGIFMVTFTNLFSRSHQPFPMGSALLLDFQQGFDGRRLRYDLLSGNSEGVLQGGKNP